MNASERKQQCEEAMRVVETSLDKLRRAARKNETAALRLQKRPTIESLAPLLEPEEPGLTDSGLHDLG